MGMFWCPPPSNSTNSKVGVEPNVLAPRSWIWEAVADRSVKLRSWESPTPPNWEAESLTYVQRIAPVKEDVASSSLSK